MFGEVKTGQSATTIGNRVRNSGATVSVGGWSCLEGLLGRCIVRVGSSRRRTSNTSC